jgi:hypothetical protein
MRTAVAIVVLWFAACADPVDDQGLAEARQRWEGQAVASYTFIWSEACFCDPDRVRPIRIRVASGQIVDATYVNDQSAVDSSKRGFLLTIEGLFDKIQTTVDDGLFFTAEFDETWGYPASLFIDPARNATDDEHTISVLEFAPAS